jgi:sugar/nucleoside kinase (ribokinase family)
VYDIGAGDTFHAGLLAAHLSGMGPQAATRFASDAAALRISRDATRPNPTFEEARRLSEKPVE